MGAIEKRARELLAAEYEFDSTDTTLAAGIRSGVNTFWCDDLAVRAIIAALKPPEGYVLVPVEPTEAMLDAMYTSLDLDGKVLKEMWNNALAASTEAK